MKRIKWNLDYSFIEEEAVKPKDEKKFFESIFLGAIQNRWKDGIGFEYQRRLLKILDKIEASTDDFVDLEDSEYEFMKDCFENAKFQPQMVKFVNQIYVNLETAT